ncbi:hypothetical protein D3C77_344220 [compost metagenome]
MHFAEERGRVVLALTVIHNILHNNKLFMVLFERNSKHIARIHLVTAIYFFIHPSYPSRCIDKTFPLNILANQLQDFTNVVFYLLPVGSNLGIYIIFDACHSRLLLPVLPR